MIKEEDGVKIEDVKEEMVDQAENKQPINLEEMFTLPPEMQQ